MKSTSEKAHKRSLGQCALHTKERNSDVRLAAFLIAVRKCSPISTLKRVFSPYQAKLGVTDMQSLVTAQHHVHRPGLPFYAQAHPAIFRCFFGESAQFLAQVIIPILDFVRNSICALRQPPLNSNHAGVTSQKSTLSLSEGLIYNLLLSDLKLTKSGEQRKQNHTSIQHRQARTSHQTYSQSTKSTCRLP